MNSRANFIINYIADDARIVIDPSLCIQNMVR